MVGRELAGGVTAGLAPYSTVNAIALPLLTAVRERYPSILLHINQNFGGVLSEAMMTSRMDMALLYDAGPIKGVDFVRLLTEELMVVAPAGTGLPGAAGTAVSIKELVDLPLLLPGPMHTIRKVVEQAYEYAFEQARVVGEVESVTLMAQVVRKRIGRQRVTAVGGAAHHERREPRVAPHRADNRGSSVARYTFEPAAVQAGRGGARSTPDRRSRSCPHFEINHKPRAKTKADQVAFLQRVVSGVAAPEA